MVERILLPRAVMRIVGDDARPFLQGLLTQDVLNVGIGQGAFAALLTPQGKVLFDLLLTPVDGGFLVDIDTGSINAFMQRLSLFKLRSRVSLIEEPDLAVWAGQDPSTPPPDAIAAFTDPRLTALGWRAIVPRVDDATPLAHRYEAVRIGLGVPAAGADFGPDEVFLLDVNYDALNGVNYKKGCFVGQEVTSRMKRKGEIRKRTLIAETDAMAPRRGAPILAGETRIGSFMSGSANVALAVVRLDRLDETLDTRTETGDRVRLRLPDYLKPA